MLSYSEPIPEPPRVVPSRPWVQDTSIDSSNHKKQNRTRPTTTIHPSEDVLKQLRLKYGIVTCEDNQDSLIENIKLIDPNDIYFNSEQKCNSLEEKLHNIQSNIRSWLTKLQQEQIWEPGMTNKMCQCCAAQKELVSKSTENNFSLIPKQIFDCIAKQNEQLNIIIQKINYLLKLYQGDKQQENKDSCKVRNQINMVGKHSIQTVASFASFGNVLNNLADFPKKASLSEMSSDSSRSYLDSSIEKVRKDLHENVKISLQENQTLVKRIYSPNEQSDRNKSLTDLSSEPLEEDQLYSNILSQINSILIRNGSCCTSSTDGSGLGCRSSRSITPDTFSYKNQADNKESNRKYQKKLDYQDKLRKRHPRQLLQTEQSIYIQRLASKYRIDENENGDCSERRDSSSDDHMQQDHQIILESIRMAESTTSKTPKKLSTDNYQCFRTCFNCYALTDHNSSIATKNYLRKYGLAMNHHKEKCFNYHSMNPAMNHNCHNHKSPMAHLVLNEKDEKESCEDFATTWQNQIGFNIHSKVTKKRDELKEDINHKTDGQLMKSGDGSYKEIKSCPNQKNLDRLIDLDFMRRLPKLK